MAAGDLTTLANVKAWLGIDTNTSLPSDTLLSALITSASDFVSKYLDRSLLSASYSELREGNGQTFMLLRQWPVTAVASVSWSGQSITTAADPIALTSGFLFDDRKLSLIGYRFPSRLPIVIAYTAGYASVPASVQQAVNELVGEAFKRRDRIGQSSKTLGGQETTAFSQADMNKTIASMLAPYRAMAPI